MSPAQRRRLRGADGCEAGREAEAGIEPCWGSQRARQRREPAGSSTAGLRLIPSLLRSCLCKASNCCCEPLNRLLLHLAAAGQAAPQPTLNLTALTLRLVTVDVDGRVNCRGQILAGVVLKRMDHLHRERASRHLAVQVAQAARRAAPVGASKGGGAGGGQLRLAQVATRSEGEVCSCSGKGSCPRRRSPQVVSRGGAAASASGSRPPRPQPACTPRSHVEHGAGAEVGAELLAVQRGTCHHKAQALVPGGRGAGRQGERRGPAGSRPDEQSVAPRACPAHAAYAVNKRAGMQLGPLIGPSRER